MLFNSYPFILVFLPVIILLIVAISRSGSLTAVLACLVAASVVFYGFWEVSFVPLLIASITANFVSGFFIHRFGSRTKKAYLVLLFILIVDLGILAYFKYSVFAVDTLNSLLATSIVGPAIGLPLGISFYTFHQIAYVVEMYRGGIRQPNAVRYSLFVSFFPQLIAGPILFAKDMLPQFEKPELKKLHVENIAVGLTIFVMGLIKKVILADGVAPHATMMFGAALNGEKPMLLQAWAGVLAFGFQIYFDFSGYSDMAIGLARMFGVILPLNFYSPYKASSIISFWRRWHITLSRFLRDYLYIPLGGNRQGPARRHVNLMITMLLGGLWHGAGWTFVIWGALHGIYLVINHLWRTLWRHSRRNLRDSLAVRFISLTATFLAVTIAWVFFRAGSLNEAISVLSGMAGLHGIALPHVFRHLLGLNPIVAQHWGIEFGFRDPMGFGPDLIQKLVICAVVVWGMPNTQQIVAAYHRSLDYYGHLSDGGTLLRWKPTAAWAIGTGAMLAWCLFLINRPAQFIYFKF
jgi:alginate O-acetyltransferase complex protein AlgI